MDSQDIILLLVVLLVLLLIARVYLSNENDTNNEEMINIPYTSIERYEDCTCNEHKLLYHVDHFNDVGFAPDFAWLARHNLLPWWNSTRRTKNMSYDLRGDVPIIPYYVGPWNISPLI